MPERTTLQAANDVYADGSTTGDLPMLRAARRFAVTCMDAG